MPNNFMDDLKNVLDDAAPNVSVTENGAIGLRTTGKALLDLNFKLSSMRNMTDKQIWSEFLSAYNENAALAIVWLFFARDIRGGCGERKVFRVIFSNLVNENPELASELLPLVPEFGRWDDLVWVYDNISSIKFRGLIAELICNQILADISANEEGKSVSLCAKWLPSMNTSSANTRRIANALRLDLHLTPKEYRKMLSTLRKRIAVVERDMSANKWGEIDYGAVPSKAGLNYRRAFQSHDAERYEEYLSNVRDGSAKMNAGALFPYEIVHQYIDDDNLGDVCNAYDETLELKWKNLPAIDGDGSTLVVVDGSGSMCAPIGGTSVTCHDVARSLGVYFSQFLKGCFKDSFITFSSRPKFVRFDGAESLKSKLEILIKECDCSNTNIERTFDLILQAAVNNHMKQEEMPANILIVSDMEFDSAVVNNWSMVTGTLFDSISARWAAAGYNLPRLVFWNVCSRTGTIPIKENKLGVALVSGFSPSIADMVFSGELDPYKLLLAKLESDRYAPVRKVVGLS